MATLGQGEDARVIVDVLEGAPAVLWERNASVSGAETELRLRHLRRVIESRNPALRRDLGLRTDPLELKESGNPTIRATGIAGSLDLGLMRLEIAPKYSAIGTSRDAWQANLIALIEFASKRRAAFFSTERSALRTSTFADRLGFAYAEALRHARLGPPIRSYRSVDGEGRTVRGRLRVTAQVRLSLRRPDLVAYEHSELDTDNAENRILRWAAKRLISSARDAKVRRLLSYELSKLPSGVLDAPPTRMPGTLAPQYSHYDNALALAAGVLAGRGLTTGNAQTTGADFVVGTERLFESFLERRLGVVAWNKDGWTVRPQHQTRFAFSTGNRRDYFSRPDNLLTTADGLGLVVDAKYKRFADSVDGATGRPSNSDIYQMVAACVAHKQSRALLIYPSAFGGASAFANDPDPAQFSVEWWATPLAPQKEVHVGATCVNVSVVRDSASLEAFDCLLAKVVSDAMQMELEARS